MAPSGGDPITAAIREWPIDAQEKANHINAFVWTPQFSCQP